MEQICVPTKIRGEGKWLLGEENEIDNSSTVFVI